MVDQSSKGMWWIIYHRAFYLFEQGLQDRNVALRDCADLRDYLFQETGTLQIPDIGNGGLSVEGAVCMAWTHLHWLKKKVAAKQ